MAERKTPRNETAPGGGSDVERRRHELELEARVKAAAERNERGRESSQPETSDAPGMDGDVVGR